MWRFRWALVLGLLAGSGCNRDAAFLEVAGEQEKVFREVTAILAKIHDEKDMAAAKEELDARFARCEKIARRARELAPPQPDGETPVNAAAMSIQNAFNDMHVQVTRVRRLPGGEEFFAQFRGSLP